MFRFCYLVVFLAGGCVVEQNRVVESVDFVDQWWDLGKSGWNVYFENDGQWYYALFVANSGPPHTWDGAHWGGDWEEVSRYHFSVYDVDSASTVKMRINPVVVDGESCFDYNFGPWYHDVACPYVPGDWP